MSWLVKHALRTLLKQGHLGALQTLGFTTDVSVQVESLKLNKETVQFGDYLEFFLELSSSQKKPQKLLVDYVIYHMKANGKLSPKVFKMDSKNHPRQRLFTPTKETEF